ncbi:uncharacterized protein LOC108626817 isoform X2 [Ceratina calcarata]|uniref:Uncharacterized protein LOC108626817 isoform X2 n=1 Tax=Ceratina calcarata TaxID=156304 RepID=A0AAJ7J2F3_9HYME|nr:uncharacterized protein LOC108626817 isoform X2 [Ceratina calcarata]
MEGWAQGAERGTRMEQYSFIRSPGESVTVPIRGIPRGTDGTEYIELREPNGAAGDRREKIAEKRSARSAMFIPLVQFHEIKPAVHLDNRYRLMRHEPMLDAEGQRTDKIGKDETAPPSMEELKKLREDPKFYNYYAPKRRIFFTR